MTKREIILDELTKLEAQLVSPSYIKDLRDAISESKEILKSREVIGGNIDMARLSTSYDKIKTGVNLFNNFNLIFPSKAGFIEAINAAEEGNV